MSYLLTNTGQTGHRAMELALRAMGAHGRDLEM